LPLPINTVYRRQFDVLKHRYERALDGAKRAAYLARLAIEQRLGTRLGDLVQSIGPIEAPSLWADQLVACRELTTNKLSAANPGTAKIFGPGGPSGGSDELDLVKGFADQFVGDYVARLKEFVEFYNIQFPFREATTRRFFRLEKTFAVLRRNASANRKNLLFHSDQLVARSEGSQAGWRVADCDEATCLDISPRCGR